MLEVESKQAGEFESNSSDQASMTFFLMLFTIGPWKVTGHLLGTWEKDYFFPMK